MGPISLAHKTILITGANSGIGYEVARQCLLHQAKRIIVAVRSIEKGNEAVLSLRANPAIKKANPTAKLDVYKLDLDDYQSGLEFTKKMKREVKNLDVLICNAGVNILKYTTSRSGHERVIQVNAYSNFLLILKLLPLLRSTATTRNTPSRLVMVGSLTQSLHTVSNLPENKSILSYLDNKSTYNRLRQYPNSKLLANAFIQHLALKVPAQELIANTTCPGFVATNFDKELPVLLRGVAGLVRRAFARSVEDGGRSIFNAAVLVGEDAHGRFMSYDNRVTSNPPLLEGKQGEQFRERLWEEVISDLKKVDESCGIE